MQTDYYQKISILVKNTPVLTSVEKDEWLELLELMTDHQLLELERILSSSQNLENRVQRPEVRNQQNLNNQYPTPSTQAKPAVISPVVPQIKTPAAPAIPSPIIPKPPLVKPQFPAPGQQPPLAGNKIVDKPATATSAPKTGAGPGIPIPSAPKAAPLNQVKPPVAPAQIPFSHILNLPKAGAPPPASPHAPVSPPQVESKIQDQKKLSPFFQKLKEIFAEKELPAPKETFGPLSELAELSAPHAKPLPQKLPPEPKKPAAKPIPLPPKIQKPHEKKPVPKKPEQGPKNITFNLYVNSDKNQAPQPSLGANLQQPGGVDLKSLNDLTSAISEKLGGAAKPEIKQPAATAGQQAKPLGETGPSKPQPPKPPVSIPAVPSRPKPLEKQLLSTLEPDSFRKSAPENFPDFSGVDRSNHENQIAPGQYINPEKERQRLASSLMLSDEEIKAMSRGLTSSSQGSQVSPGLNFLDDSRAGSLSDGKEKIDENAAKKQIERIRLTEKQGDEMKLETLGDTAGLKPKDLEDHATRTFLVKLQKLIARYGQHEVVFNLEKSPLYKAYVNTGVTWLKGMASQPSAGDQLNKENFEHFTDLLIILGSKT